MKNIRILVIAAALLALVGLLGFLLLSKNKQTATADTQTVPTATLSTTETTQNGQITAPLDAKVTLGTVPTREVIVEASEFKFTPSTITVKKGETVKLTLKNTGKTTHDWMVDKLGGASIDATLPQNSSSIIFTPSQKGTFSTYCSIGNHKAMGMVGKLIVQ